MQREVLPANDAVLSNLYADRFNIPIELAQLVARRFPEFKRAEMYLNPRLTGLHEPEMLPDIGAVADRLLKKTQNNEPILIYGHDDPDGFTSTALICIALKEISRGEASAVHAYTFDREHDGYILNPQVLQKYHGEGCRTVLTVDYGVSSAENFRIAAENGYELLVCDHHETRLESFPVPTIDPKRFDSKYPFRDLAGAGVTLKLATSLYQRALGLKPDEFYALKKEFLVLAMIGTIADRVPLLDENRIICHAGIKAIGRIERGFVKGFTKDGAVDFGRVISEIIPTIASAAYVENQKAVELLISDNEERIDALIAELKEVTRQRRARSAEILNMVTSAAKLFKNIALCVVPHVRQHYLGSIAARICDHFNRVSLIISINEDRCHGELRSAGLDLHSVLARHGDLFIDYGGHQKAAGFTAEYRKLESIIDAITIAVDDQEPADRPGEKTEPEISIKKDRVSVLIPMLPFGEGNEPPLLTDGFSVYTIDNWLNISERGP